MTQPLPVRARASRYRSVGRLLVRVLGVLAVLLVLSVVPDTLVLPAIGDVRQFGSGQAQGYRESLDAAVAGLPDGVRARGELRPGPVVDALTELRPDECDLLVCGSHGYGPLLLAGAEGINLNKNFKFGLNDSGLMYQGKQ